MEILIIGKLWPEPKSSAAGRRMMQLIELLKLEGNVTFACAAHRTGLESELSVVTKEISLNNDSFDEFVRVIAPDIVVFDRFMTEEQFGWRIMENCPDAIRILNTEDLHFLRKTRGEALKSKIGTHDKLNFQNDHTMRELAAIYRCDLTLLTSDYEVELLIEKFSIPQHLLFYLPIFSKGIVENLVSFSERKDLVFIGNYLHEPNLDAVIYLKKEIWPLIRNVRTDISIHIYGAYPTQQILEFDDPSSGFFVHGRTEDLNSVLGKARILFAPLRFGAGIKGKLLDAMELGTPSVTTSIGIEGIADKVDWPGLVENSPKGMVSAISELYDNEKFWVEKQETGAELLKSKFNLNKYNLPFKSRITELKSDVQIHRNRSFTSQIIQHQSLLATKYLSKWIMEKKQVK